MFGLKVLNPLLMLRQKKELICNNTFYLSQLTGEVEIEK